MPARTHLSSRVLLREHRGRCHRCSSFGTVFLASLLCVAGGGIQVFAAELRFPKSPSPASDSFLLDEAGVLSGEAADEARAGLQEALKSDPPTPVRLVIVRSIAEYGAARKDGWNAGNYADALFLRWSLAEIPRIGAGGDRTTGDGAGEQGGPRDQEGAPGATETTSVPNESDPSGSPPTRPSFAERGILVLISVEDERVAVATAPPWNLRPRNLRNLKRVFAHELARGNWDRAARRGVAALQSLAAGRRVRSPGGVFLSVLFVVGFTTVFLTVVSYLRAGRDGRAYQIWSVVLSATATAITFVVRRGVEFSAGVSGLDSGEEERGRWAYGRW